MGAALFVSSFLGSALLSWALLHPAAPLRILDQPNERSLHSTPIPRTGGIAIVAVAMGALGVVAGLLPTLADFYWLLAGAVAVALISFLDDRYSLSPAFRIIVHLGAAATAAAGGFALMAIRVPGAPPLRLSFAAGALLSTLFIAWMINLYNFMDGMDGFAGGMAIVGFGTFAALGRGAQHDLFAGFNLVLVGAAAGFLLFNFAPARIFMGDTGASTLGYFAAVAILWADRHGLFPWWIGVLVFSPFIVDATTTLIRRLARREPVWRAHKTHFYQRLVQLGWGHRKTVLAEYALMGACSAAAVAAVALTATGQWIVVGIVAVLYTGSAVAIRRAEKRRRHAPPPGAGAAAPHG